MKANSSIEVENLSYKRICAISIVAAILSWGIFLLCSNNTVTGLQYNSNALRMSTGWTVSDGEKTIYEASDFYKVGYLKKQREVILEKTLPATSGESLCFTTIGYTVEAWLDNEPLYRFGTAPDGYDVWGTKTHVIPIPDSTANRELRLAFSTNHPANIAVSFYVLLDDEIALAHSLLKSSLVELCFATLYISIGAFMLLYSLIAVVFRLRNVNFAFLMLALTALLMGGRILFNIAAVNLHTGSVFAFFSLYLLDLAIPIPALLFAAADKRFQKSRLLLAAAGVQGAALVLFLVLAILDVGDFLLYWRIPLFALCTAAFLITFIREFHAREGRPMLSAAVFVIAVALLTDAQVYFQHGSYYSMDYNLSIFTFPALVLLIGKTLVDSVQKELRLKEETTTLRIEGELLFENYRRLDRHIEDTKKIWHDIDKHFSMMGRMLADGEYEKLKTYFSQMGHDIRQVKSAYLCDNKLVNAILTDKAAEAENKGIEIGFEGNLPENLSIRGNDLCSLLVNMLDNAIEACESIPEGKEKKISVTLKMQRDYVFFNVTNSSSVSPQETEEGFRTTKADDTYHGYGVAIIQRIAAKYGGVFDTNATENSFTARVALKNSPSEEDAF